jgi:hypothetical protein
MQHTHRKEKRFLLQGTNCDVPEWIAQQSTYGELSVRAHQLSCVRVEPAMQSLHNSHESVGRKFRKTKGDCVKAGTTRNQFHVPNDDDQA